MIVVTAGSKYTDIDTLACVIAYEELLRKGGKEVTHLLINSYTENVPQLVKEFGYAPNYNIPEYNEDTKFVIVDISDPEYLPKFVDKDKIIEIFDHHFGFERFWEDRLGKNSHIREIGACATLIYQEWLKSGLLQSISQISANLLITAIISNSLNFKASVTKDDDKEAYIALLQYASLSENWPAVYFSTVSSVIYANPVVALQKDTKTFEIEGKTVNIGQLEVWDSSNIVGEKLKKIVEHLKDDNFKGFVTIADISNGFNSIICIDPNVQDILKRKLGFSFNGEVYKTDLLYLRKELIKGLLT